jgi:hypothetical protein
MPCRDYESDNGYHQRDEYKKQCDKLARIACKAMEQLEKSGRADFILIEDDELREWWSQHKEADRKEKARIAEIERRKKVKEEALAKLSDEEKELLGISSPKKVKGVSKADVAGMATILQELDILKKEYDWDYAVEEAEDDMDFTNWNKAKKR